MVEALTSLPDLEAQRGARFWRQYVFSLIGLSVFAVLFGQFFLALEFADNIGRAVLDRLLAISVIALFLERAIEVYVGASRRLGMMSIEDAIADAEDETPDDRRLLRRLNRQLAVYKIETQRIVFLVGLVGGVLIACTGLRVLDGLIILSDEFKRNPVWQGRVWFGVDILLTGGVIGGGAAGVHELIKTLSGQGFKGRASGG